MEKVDIIARLHDERTCVQTDHREREEIEADREISIVFAITRIISPALRDPECRKVVYACEHEPPEFLREVVRACGAALFEDGSEPREPAPPADHRLVARIAHEAMMELGRAVFARERLDPTPEGLRELEEQSKSNLEVEGDEIAYYTSMVELGAAAGVVLAAGRDGQWRLQSESVSLVPLVLEIGDGNLNVFGRTERYFSGTVGQGPSALLAFLAEAPSSEESKLVGVLKSPDWSPGVALLSEPLFPSSEKAGLPLPRIVYGYDHPQTLSYFRKDDTTMSLVEARERAHAFYRSIPVSVERISSYDVWRIAGDYYAPEKLLDVDFAKSLHARLDADLLVVGLPCRHMAAVAPATRDPAGAIRQIGAFIRVAQDNAEPNDHISAVPFIMFDGAILGFAQWGDAPDPAPKKGFWKRLFGGA